MKLRTGSLVRGAGVGLACLVPGLEGRTQAVLASYAAGWPLDKPGLQVFVIVPDEDDEAWRRAAVPFATSAASWTATMLLAVSAVRRSTVPAPVAALAMAGLVAVGDSALADFGARARTRAAAVRDRASAGQPVGEP